MIIENGTVFSPKGAFIEDSLYIKDSIICDKSELKNKNNIQKIDASGMHVVPGFIDIHFHGCNRQDFMNESPLAIDTIASYQASNGITSISPATMTMSVDSIKTAITNALNFKPKTNQSSVEGVYLEGPFINEKKKGAQNGTFVLAPDERVCDDLIKAGKGLVKVVTIAPEINGACKLVEKYKDKVNFSIAHTCATYEDTLKAIDSGARELTHTFNAMNPIHHRAPGPIAAASEYSDKIYAELICDGVHIHKGAVRLLFKLFENIVLISDSMEATGLEDGQYQLGGQKVNVKGNRAELDDGTIAGSVTNLYNCFVCAVKENDIPIEKALIACSLNPAKVLKIDNKVGSLELGKRADILLIDKKTLKLEQVILRGNLI